MPNKNEIPVENFDEADDDDFDPSDFGFIISADGELKSMMYPDELLEDPPEEIQLILKLFGISDINELSNRTIH
jgi:hypothetical protein